jgi:hypothetical protein
MQKLIPCLLMGSQLVVKQPNSHLASHFDSFSIVATVVSAYRKRVVRHGAKLVLPCPCYIYEMNGIQTNNKPRAMHNF